ncbi:unnamed protein product [Allacma fusca]|uniref:Uncharacterized protein n=1 Tax=Allacma fusca TaxID=39272 RepID=A0A8J2KGY2_9HEXA|nr:unnamed protein product [Allacma fusca]
MTTLPLTSRTSNRSSTGILTSYLRTPMKLHLWHIHKQRLDEVQNAELKEVQSFTKIGLIFLEQIIFGFLAIPTVIAASKYICVNHNTEELLIV